MMRSDEDEDDRGQGEEDGASSSDGDGDDGTADVGAGCYGRAAAPADPLEGLTLDVRARLLATGAGHDAKKRKRPRPAPPGGPDPSANPTARHQSGSSTRPPVPPTAAALAAAKIAARDARRRKHRHAPQELPANRPVGRTREVLDAGDGTGANPRRAIDPRFFNAVGDVATAQDRARFRKRYRFLFDEALPAERDRLRAMLASRDLCGSDGRGNGLGPAASQRRLDVRRALDKVEARLAAEMRARREERVDTEIRRRERAAVAAGKKPYYLKSSARKTLLHVARYDELAASKGKRNEGGTLGGIPHGGAVKLSEVKAGKGAGGGKRLERALEKRRARTSAADHRALPGQRR